MRDGSGSSPRSTCRRTPRRTIRSCLRARPTASRRTASTSTRPRSARRRVRAKRATSSSIRTCAAGSCPRASSSNMRPHMPDKRGPTDSTRAPTPTTPSTGSSRTCQQQRPRRHVGHLVSRASTPSAGIIDAHPALKAASPQAPIDRLVHGRRLPSQRRVLLPHAFNFFTRFGTAASGADVQDAAAAVRLTGRPTATTSSSQMGPLANANAKYLQERRRRSGTT